MSPVNSSRPTDVHQLVRSGVSSATIIKWMTAARRRWPSRRGLVSVVVAGPVRMRQINRQYRHRDRATNVLSFHFATEGKKGAAEHVWGEIVLCPAVIRREAVGYNHSYRQHFRFLLYHGFLHLLGHDHRTAAQQRRWEKLERRLPL